MRTTLDRLSNMKPGSRVKLSEKDIDSLIHDWCAIQDFRIDDVDDVNALRFLWAQSLLDFIDAGFDPPGTAAQDRRIDAAHRAFLMADKFLIEEGTYTDDDCEDEVIRYRAVVKKLPKSKSKMKHK